MAVTVELPAVEDAGVIESIPTFNGGGAPYFVLHSRFGGDFDYNYVLFDLSVLPANATIDAAVFRLHLNAAANPMNLELGRAEGAWSEASITWNTQPSTTWAGFMQTATAVGDVDWPVKPLLTAWLTGTQPNYGVVVRGLTPNTGAVLADTSEGAIPPKLVVTYTIADEEGARPDLGDAPDSTNHHGIVNQAYAGVPGNFPTVWEGTPAGQPAGPRHANQTLEGWLGNFMSRENEADIGPDADGPNNILRGAGGMVGDVADNDRGDDGWRNRGVQFFNCQRTTLTVRISKAAAATRNTMYLNVWFDGNRDGDWADVSPCPMTEGEPAQAGYEWIVQDYIVDMTAIAGGGLLDFFVNTEKVANSTGNQTHWLRFTLSETPAVQPVGSLADGRGPHPGSALGAFNFGETEDIFQRPAPEGENGVLELQKRVITTAEPTEWLDYVTYEIVLRHNGGTQPIQAQLRDELPYPLVVYPTIDANGIEYVSVDSPTGGAVPLQAALEVKPPQFPNPPQQVVRWEGSLAPNAEVRLTFQVRVLTLCEPDQQIQTIINTAQARQPGGPVITAADTFTAKCLGYDENHLEFEATPMTDFFDLADLLHVPAQIHITNTHPFTVALGLFQQPVLGDVAVAAVNRPRFLERVTLPPNAASLVDIDLRMESEFTDELQLVDENHRSRTSRFVCCPATTMSARMPRNIRS